jgi:hypothetical protein
MTPEARARWERRLAGELVPIPDEVTRQREKRAYEEQVLAELATASLIPAELLPPERETSGYDPRRFLRE